MPCAPLLFIIPHPRVTREYVRLEEPIAPKATIRPRGKDFQIAPSKKPSGPLREMQVLFSAT
jgi:hypothetical protein